MKKSDCMPCKKCGRISAWARLHESQCCGKCIEEKN